MAGHGKKRTKRQEDAMFSRSTRIRKLPHDDSITRQHLTHTRHSKEEVMPSAPKPLPKINLAPRPPLLEEPDAGLASETMEDEDVGRSPDPSELEGEQTQVSNQHPFSTMLFY
jgi:hypothetical protein